jgi:glutathione peroxidase-family protein
MRSLPALRNSASRLTQSWQRSRLMARMLHRFTSFSKRRLGMYIPFNLFFRVKAIGWNFEKFLVDSKGEVLKHYGSGVTPQDLEADIAPLINASL